MTNDDVVRKTIEVLEMDTEDKQAYIDACIELYNTSAINLEQARTKYLQASQAFLAVPTEYNQNELLQAVHNLRQANIAISNTVKLYNEAHIK